MMFLRSPAPPAGPRRGVILLVVITMVTLFAVVGLSFVFYAEAEATASKLAREAESQYRPDVDPEMALAYFLGKLIYGERDDEAGVYSALRGHDLARTMYGGDYDLTNGVVVLKALKSPFAGTGRLHFKHQPAGPNVPAVLADQDDYPFINYTYFPPDGFLRDPERPGYRPNLQTARATWAGGFHVPYTYPDLNNFYLGAVRADGTVLSPSFHREYLFGRL